MKIRHGLQQCLAARGGRMFFFIPLDPVGSTPMENVQPPWFPWRSCQIQRRQRVRSTPPQWRCLGSFFWGGPCCFISSSFEKQIEQIRSMVFSVWFFMPFHFGWSVVCGNDPRICQKRTEPWSFLMHTLRATLFWRLLLC